MTFVRESLEYQVLNECKCGPEEFSVLVSSVEEADIETFLSALVRLVHGGYLTCARGRREGIDLRMDNLREYVGQRMRAGEALEEYPEVCEEYQFTTTEKGIDLLLPEDRPVST